MNLDFLPFLPSFSPASPLSGEQEANTLSAMALAAPITCATAGSLSVVYGYLQLKTALHRVQTKLIFGTKKEDGTEAEDMELVAKMRAGGNMQVRFPNEFVPTGLILLLLLETSTQLSPKLVAAFGAVFAVSRLSHAYALASACKPGFNHIPPRKYGFLTTIGCLVAAGSYLTYAGVQALRK
ncbi:hypothetical protein TSOC_003313 [Tetrabaena socialis]|uniref:Uncharacterized protein n=1 Tax=Tetrabaena socialis TaxID=47790 RepID=A0A2J8ABZ5_9CHLO|nr:hypothetical protein TSOC_003313 [Tetrabaena socialis]|eukprot:PNH10017.1 hypothetical protein TSOC_003313 [Tetrabaena socialis]